METTAYNFHDDDGSTVGQFKLHAGNEIKNKAQQCCYDGIALKLYRIT